MKTVLNVKTDVEVKAEAQALAKHLGIPLSTVVNAYLKEFVKSGEFRVVREPVLKREVERELRKQLAETNAGKNLSPGFTNVKEASAWLKSKL